MEYSFQTEHPVKSTVLGKAEHVLMRLRRRKASDRRARKYVRRKGEMTRMWGEPSLNPWNQDFSLPLRHRWRLRFQAASSKHFAAADGCPGNTLHRSGPTDGNHDIAAQLSRPCLCGQTYYVYDNVYYRAHPRGYVVGS